MTDAASSPGRLREALAARFNLRTDVADHAVIDAGLRAGAELTGANAWILICAIFIASIGLNVNSTAVIIGAMLVSPLMGPILAIGYGVGVSDFRLIRRAFANLTIAAAISLVTSTAYFLLSPLAEAQSELLARTAPTVWDVLIAFLGGMAGMVAVTRREKSNVIPGVAIATALMPPLCTAGYGLAKGQPAFVAGALYLFTINGVFIGIATVMVTSLLGLPRRAFIDFATERRVRIGLAVVAVVVALPSLYLASRLVGREVFDARARQFVRAEFQFPTSHVTDLQISANQRQIELTLLGDPLPPETKTAIEGRLAGSGLAGATLVIHQARTVADAEAIRQRVLRDLARDTATTSQKDQEITRLRAELARVAALQQLAPALATELKAQYPQLDAIVVGQGTLPGAAAPEQVILVSAEASSPLSEADRDRIIAWLRVRAAVPQVRLMMSPAPPTLSGAAPVRAPTVK